MNPVVMTLEGLLAVLLAATLLFGLKLERKLKALRNSQAGFASAVRDLDGAAARAAAGLDALRYATENAKDVLVQRMEAAQSMALRLEELTVEAEMATRKADAAAKSIEASAELAAERAAAAAAAAAAMAAARPEPAPQSQPALEHRYAAPAHRIQAPAAPAEAPAMSSRLREAADLLRGARR